VTRILEEELAMLTLAVVEEIAFHLEAGLLSQRAIAKKLSVSRATVRDIADGRRGKFGREDDVEPEEPERSDPPVRCPECGYLVHLPCLACRTREYRRAQLILARMSKRRAPVPLPSPRRPKPLPALRRRRVA
jgi:hypothetical protein